jgi:hypothetical protein
MERDGHNHECLPSRHFSGPTPLASPGCTGPSQVEWLLHFWKFVTLQSLDFYRNVVCESGEIGRRTRLRIWRLTGVGVRIPPFASIWPGVNQQDRSGLTGHQPCPVSVWPLNLLRILRTWWRRGLKILVEDANIEPEQSPNLKQRDAVPNVSSGKVKTS